MTCKFMKPFILKKKREMGMVNRQMSDFNIFSPPAGLRQRNPEEKRSAFLFWGLCNFSFQNLSSKCFPSYSSPFGGSVSWSPSSVTALTAGSAAWKPGAWPRLLQLQLQEASPRASGPSAALGRGFRSFRGKRRG